MVCNSMKPGETTIPLASMVFSAPASSFPMATSKKVSTFWCGEVMIGSAYGIRTRDLRLERAVSLATRRMRHEHWLGILGSNQGFQIQSLTSYR